MTNQPKVASNLRESLPTDVQAYMAELEAQVEALTRSIAELTNQIQQLGAQAKPLSELEQRAEEHASFVLPFATSPQRTPAIQARLGISFLIALLEGRFTYTRAALELARILGLNPDGTYRVGIFVLDSALPLSREAVLRREVLGKQLGPLLEELNAPTLRSVALDRLRFLIPADCPAERIWQAFAAPDLALIVGKAYKGLNNIKQGYDEVIALLPQVTPGRLYRFEDLLMDRVLMGDVQARVAFINQLFAPLRCHKNGEVLVETLLSLARNSFRLNQTAESLYIHPKTLRYRLDRAAEIASLDLDDGEIRFQLQLAARFLSLEDKKS